MGGPYLPITPPSRRRDRPNHWFASEGSKWVAWIRSGEIVSNLSVRFYDQAPGEDQDFQGRANFENLNLSEPPADRHPDARYPALRCLSGQQAGNGSHHRLAASKSPGVTPAVPQVAFLPDVNVLSAFWVQVYSQE